MCQEHDPEGERHHQVGRERVLTRLGLTSASR